MFPHKIFKKTLRGKYPREFKSLKVFGSPEDPYWVCALRIGNVDIMLEYFSSLGYVVMDKYGDNPETLWEGSGR